MFQDPADVRAEYGPIADLDVTDPPELTPAEKEVTLGVARDEDQLRVTSEVGSVTRRLLAHDGFEVEGVRVVDGVVTAVTGRLPVGYLSVGTTGRKSSNLSGMVSDGVFS
jgi:hypothetical protein